MLQVSLDATCWVIFLSINFTTIRPSSDNPALWSLTAIMIGGVVGDGVPIWQWWPYRGNRASVSRQEMMIDAKSPGDSATQQAATATRSYIALQLLASDSEPEARRDSSDSASDTAPFTTTATNGELSRSFFSTAGPKRA
ncbi:hypothetical protein LTR95_009246 [Oleoguttula sp. CCFEE 5521]